MTPAEQLAHELRDLSARMRRVPPQCLRDGTALVEWLADLSKIPLRAATLLAPAERVAPRVQVAETRFTPGTIAGPNGRLVRVERRRRAA